MSTVAESRETLQKAWADAWPTALAAWSRYTRLRSPQLCLSSADARQEGLSGSFAMIRLEDQRVVIDLEQIEAYGLGDFAPEILAHEIGHHILAPATLTDHARMVARMRRALPTRETDAGMIANLYTDLLINDRLQRSAELRMAEVFKALPAASPSSRLWALYQRMYEHLWQLPKGSLIADALDDATEGDAWLGARLVRSYAREWLDGAGSFAALCLPYLLDSDDMADVLKALHDTASAAKGGWPGGLIAIEEGEDQPIVHPSNDPRITGEDTSAVPATANPVELADGMRGQAGQCREPFEYGEILKGCGINLNDHEIAIRYYRERALPHLVRFPSRPSAMQADPLPEGLDPWEPGDPLDQIDWMQSLLQSPTLIPGVTTVQRHWGQDSHVPPKRQPVDLDLYVDCSGSMPHPQYRTSYTTLAGAILCLSALRAGARVKVTLWSGKRQFTATEGFVMDEHSALSVLTDYFGGGTAFPIHLLRTTYERPRERPAHIVILSDDGVSTLYDTDEWGNDGYLVADKALRLAGGGGTLVLNLPWSLDVPLQKSYASDYWSQSQNAIKRARDEQGWAVYEVRDWDGMIEFARQFSKSHYAPPGESDVV